MTIVRFEGKYDTFVSIQLLIKLSNNCKGFKTVETRAQQVLKILNYRNWEILIFSGICIVLKSNFNRHKFFDKFTQYQNSTIQNIRNFVLKTIQFFDLHLFIFHIFSSIQIIFVFKSLFKFISLRLKIPHTNPFQGKFARIV